jgi:signal peptidase I
MPLKDLARHWPKKIRMKLVFFLKYMLVSVFIALLVRIFITEAYFVPSGSMIGTILPGELILVNKLPYGARLEVNENTGKTIRIPGFSHIKHNDIIVFNFPEGDTIYKNRPDLNFYDYAGWQSRGKALHDTIEHGSLVYQPVKYRQPYVKRCIGLPGDTVRFFKNAVFVNNLCVKDLVHFWEHIKDSIKREPFDFLKSKFSPPRKNIHAYNYFFPHYINERWENDCYGALYIPRKGNTVKLTLLNLSLYYRIITAYEHNRLDTLQAKIYINRKIAETYTFKQDYYFMMGDNFWGSVDSRFWGFVPESHIIGKAFLVLFSSGPDETGENRFRWKRLFTFIK